MKIAITGGTGFVGSHLAKRLEREGHKVITLSRKSPLDFTGCDAVAHCAGINREIGEQTYQRVHIEGTRRVIAEAQRAGVRRIVMVSFLRARPDCGSAYHESKFAAEEMVRASGLDFTVIKAGMIYGRGDHMLDHLSHALQTFPIFLTVGFEEKPVRPLAIDDMVALMRAALVDGRMSRETIAVTGAEELLLSEAVRRVTRIVGARPLMFPAPIWVHRLLAHVWEWTMKVPLAARAQVRILSEGVVEPLPFAPSPPEDLMPRRRFTDEQIRAGLPEAGRFTCADFRCAYFFTPR